MGATLDALHALQEIERKIATIRAKTDAKRRQVKVQNRALQKQDLLAEEKKLVSRDLQMELDRVELDIKTREEAIDKHREALNRAKTNKEYAAILTAINTEKADNTKLESRDLELMASIESVRDEVAEIDAEREKILERIAKADQALQATIDASANDLSALQKEHDTIAEGLVPSVLSIFRRIADRHDGEAMAEVMVINQKRNEYACGGCNIAMTLEQVIDCKQRDDIVLCGTCGRMLYLEHNS
jgi:uncharacterized protein